MQMIDFFFFSGRKQTQGLNHARQARYHPATSPERWFSASLPLVSTSEPLCIFPPLLFSHLLPYYNTSHGSIQLCSFGYVLFAWPFLYQSPQMWKTRNSPIILWSTVTTFTTVDYLLLQMRSPSPRHPQRAPRPHMAGEQSLTSSSSYSSVSQSSSHSRNFQCVLTRHNPLMMLKEWASWPESHRKRYCWL